MSGFNIDAEMQDIETDLELESETDGRTESIMDLEDEEAHIEEKKPTDEELNKDKEKTKSKKDEDSDEEDSEEEEDSEDEELEEEKEDKEDEPKNGRSLKIKVDGKDQEKFYTDEELASAISAKEASLKRFNEVDKKNKDLEKREKEFTTKYDFVKKELSDTRSSFENLINDFVQNKKVTSNPLNSVYNLLDKMGLDTAQFDKAVLYHHIPIVAKFLDMTDEGRELFLTRHENEWHKRKTAVNEKEFKRVADYEAKLKEDNSKINQAGLTTEDVQSISEELSQMGIKDVTLDKVIEWKQLKPIYKRAENIASKIGKSDMTNKIANLLASFPDFTDEELLNNLGYKEAKKKELDDKIRTKGKPSVRKESKVEDAEIDEMFSSMFQR